MTDQSPNRQPRHRTAIPGRIGAGDVSAKCSLILPSRGACGNAARFLLPLTIPNGLLDEGLAILRDTMAVPA